MISILVTPRVSALVGCDTYYPIPCSILSSGKDRKTSQRYPDVPTTSWRIFIRSMDSFQGLTPKSPSSWHRSLAPSPQIFLWEHILIPIISEPLTNPGRGKLHGILNPKNHGHIRGPRLYDKKVVPTTLGVAWRTPNKPSLNTHPRVPMMREVRKLNSMLESLGLVPQSSNTKFVCSKEDDGEVMFIEIIRDDDEPQNEDPNEGEGATTEEPVVEYFDTFPTRDELTYHRYLMSGPIPSIFLRNPIILEGCPYNLKIPCNIGHVHIEKAYIDLNSPLNIMTRMMYNWIMRRKLDPRGNTNGGISNFTGRIKGMHVFVRNFTYVVDFMIVEDISSIIDPRLSQVILGRPFVEISNMTHDPPEGVVRFVRGADEVAYKMPHKIEQYDSLSDLEKEHTKSVYLRNEEDKRRGVEYVMSKILGFYKECLELGPEYLTGVDDEGEVT
ncbi:hypothetical protein Tco_1023825 [Tanacetum coccineum]